MTEVTIVRVVTIVTDVTVVTVVTVVTDVTVVTQQIVNPINFFSHKKYFKKKYFPQKNTNKKNYVLCFSQFCFLLTYFLSSLNNFLTKKIILHYFFMTKKYDITKQKL